VIAAAPAVLVVVGISYVAVRGLTNAERPREVARQAEPKLPPRSERQAPPAPAPVTPPAPAWMPAAVVVAERPRPAPAAQPQRPKPAVAAVRPAPEPVAVPVSPPPQSDRDLWQTYRVQAPADFNIGDEELARLLREVPEIALDVDRLKAKDEKAAEAHIKELFKDIRVQTEKDADGFVKGLEKKRADLAGLALRKGKDCRLDKKEAQALSVLSLTIRTALPGSDRRASADSVPGVYAFWSNLGVRLEVTRLKADKEQELMMRTLEQVLQVESAPLRLSLVERLKTTKGKEAGAILARRVLFDPHWHVRSEALLALKDRPHAEYAEVLLEGLRHPWAPAATHAAEAVAGLGLTEARTRLSAMLEAPDPCEPFVQKIDGKEVPVVRELVRVNHLHNCLLCHAPSTRSGRDAVPVGPVPVPYRKLPPPQVYYAERDGFEVVRADVTYLRQDFSVLQPAKNHGAWPEQQRFDFVVRTRPLTAAERTAWEKRRAPNERRPMSLHRRALLYAVAELSRQEVAAALDGGHFVPWVSVQTGSGRAWRSPCLK
jgi:hypothetical protein